MITYLAKDEITTDDANGWLSDLASNLRKSDRDEIKATCVLPPDQTLRISFFMSDLAWIGFHDGKPVVAFGLDGDCCWMLGATAIERGPASRQVARDTRRFVTAMLNRSPTIFNWVDLRNERTIRWLLWAGFSIEQINMEHGLERRPFVKVSKSNV